MQISPDPDRFALNLGPDGVYRVDGRVIPGADRPAFRIDDSDLVVGVHDRKNFGCGFLGAAAGEIS